VDALGAGFRLLSLPALPRYAMLSMRVAAGGLAFSDVFSVLWPLLAAALTAIPGVLLLKRRGRG